MNMEENTQETKTEIVKNTTINDKIMTVFFIEVKHSIKNYEEIIKKVFENFKKFTEETKIIVKYNHIKEADKKLQLINAQNVEIVSDHIYFKLNYSNLGTFKKYQLKCSVSRFTSNAYFIPENDEQKNKLLKVKNSFIKISQEGDKLLFKSRTTQGSHYYLSKQLFNDNGIVITNKNFKYIAPVLKSPVDTMV